jgi:hypothetical protein
MLTFGPLKGVLSEVASAIKSVVTLNENGSDMFSTIQNVSFNLKLEGNGSYNLIYKLGKVVLTLSKAILTPI